MGFCYIARWESTPPYVFTVIHDDELEDGTQRGKGRKLIQKIVEVRRNKKVHPALIQAAGDEKDFREMVAKADADTRKSKKEEKEKQHLAQKSCILEGKRKRRGKNLGDDYVTTTRNFAPKKSKPGSKLQRIAENVASDIDDVLQQLDENSNGDNEENLNQENAMILLCNDGGRTFTETRTTDTYNSPGALQIRTSAIDTQFRAPSPFSNSIIPQGSTLSSSAGSVFPQLPASTSSLSTFSPYRHVSSGTHQYLDNAVEAHDSQRLSSGFNRYFNPATTNSPASMSPSTLSTFYHAAPQIPPHRGPTDVIYNGVDIPNTQHKQLPTSATTVELDGTVRISKEEYQKLLRAQSSRGDDNMLEIGAGLRIHKGMFKSMESSSGESDTKLARMLFSHFFTEEELTTHSLTGKTSNANLKRGSPRPEALPALDPERTAAIIEFVVNQNHFWKEKPDPKTSTAQFTKGWRVAKNKGIIQPLRKDLSTFLWEQRQRLD